MCKNQNNEMKNITKGTPRSHLTSRGGVNTVRMVHFGTKDQCRMVHDSAKVHNEQIWFSWIASTLRTPLLLLVPILTCKLHVKYIMVCLRV